MIQSHEELKNLAHYSGWSHAKIQYFSMLIKNENHKDAIGFLNGFYHDIIINN